MRAERGSRGWGRGLGWFAKGFLMESFGCEVRNVVLSIFNEAY